MQCWSGSCHSSLHSVRHQNGPAAEALGHAGCQWCSSSAESKNVPASVAVQQHGVFPAGRRGRGALRFELDGVDKTGAEQRLTQAAIDETFSTDLLTRAVFFGQTEVNALLEV